MSTATKVISVAAPSRRYEVVVGAGVLASPDVGSRIAAAVPGARKVHVFADEGLPAAVPANLIRQLSSTGLSATSSLVRPTEDAKALQSVYHLLGQVAKHNLERRDAVIALGGGITGDMAGFVAASYRRGIPWVNCPTTLLSMVDASVGGKTGVNLRVGTELQKNMVGAFWQPSLVLADVATLGSLPERTFRSGLAECIKHAMISGDLGGWHDDELMVWSRTNMAQILERDERTLIELIARNIAVKARVVGSDEREESSGGDGGPARALLNLGHTFGHAIETLEHVSPSADGTMAPLQHGEAVALGLVCATRCAELMHLIGHGCCDAVRGALKSAGLPQVAYGLPSADEIVGRMRHDKKASGGKMKLVLPVSDQPHRCAVVDAPSDDVLFEAINAIRHG